MIAYNSSLRERSIEETLANARRIARDVGVVRVTDTTRLDRLGIPVFASIRPNATPQSLCVSAGKGLRPEEAQIGAYMEAIELAYAEPGPSSRVRIVRATGRELFASSGYSLLDFCPLDQVALDEDRPIDCAVATNLDTGDEVLVPADRVFFPYPSTFFWSDTNGLASGNTVREATVHAFAEVFERDVASFHDGNGAPPMRRVRPATLPAHLASLIQRVTELGFEVMIRTALDEYRLPFFIASLRELETNHGFHSGSGLHPWSLIAVTRAICEAFQARLTVIHGGRDDLGGHFERIKHVSQQDWQRIVETYADRKAAELEIDFTEIPDHADRATNLDATYELLRETARAAGMGAPLRIVFTPPELPIQVVKLIVPRMEFTTAEVRRTGARLRKVLDERARART